MASKTPALEVLGGQHSLASTLYGCGNGEVLAVASSNSGLAWSGLSLLDPMPSNAAISGYHPHMIESNQKN